MNLYELWEMGQRIELGLDPTGTDGLTKEIIAEKRLFSVLNEKISKLGSPVMGKEVERLTFLNER